MNAINKIFALSMAAMVFASCNDDDLKVPSQQEIEAKIIGKWKCHSENGHPVPTNVSTVLTFAQDRKGTHSFYYYDEANKRGVMVAKTPFEYSFTGNEMCERELNNSYNHDVAFYADITSISDTEFAMYNKKRTYDGKTEITDIHRIYTRITADFSDDIIGLWRGVDSENDIHGGAHHYWAYRNDGTYTYFTQSEDGVWGAFDNTLNEYLVDGDWLATHWVKDGVDYYESWNIDRIEGDRMYWSALRDNNGKMENASFVLERVKVDPTGGIIENVVGKTWMCYATFIDGKLMSQQEVAEQMHIWQHRDIHQPSALVLNRDGSGINNFDGFSTYFIYTVKDGEIYVKTTKGLESKLDYNAETGMLCAETALTDQGIVMKTIYVNETSESLEVLKEKIQGEWCGLQISVDGKVLDLDEIEQYYPSTQGVLRLLLSIEGENYDYTFSGNNVKGKLEFSPDGVVSIVNDQLPGGKLALVYRIKGDVLATPAFEIDGHLMSIVLERIRNKDWSKPCDLVGSWEMMGRYDGALACNLLDLLNITQSIPEAKISVTDMPVRFIDEKNGIINQGGVDVPFTYTVEEGQPLSKITCTMNSSYGETSVCMWYQATTYLCLFAVDNISNRKTIISYKKQ